MIKGTNASPGVAIGKALLLKEEEFNILSSTPTRTHFFWQCGENHKPWRSTATNIQQGRWCPLCSEGKWEKLARFYFENIFSAKFPKRKPSWLYEYTGHILELDGYNSKLKIAFELNGPQHYSSIYGAEKYYKQQQKFQRLQKEIKLFERLKTGDLINSRGPIPEEVRFIMTKP